MKIVFFGDKESPFANIILQGLIKSRLEPIAIFQNAKEPLNADYLKSLGADFFIVASFGKILKKEIIGIPRLGTIGAHPSLLPRLRGPSPIQSAILNDEKETGVALFLIDEKVDHGPLLANHKLRIADDDNYGSLINKLAEISVELLTETLPRIISGKLKSKPQDESLATYTKKFIAEDAFVDLAKDNSRQAWLKIKALNPEPGAYAILKLKNEKGLRLKLLEADLFPDGKLELKTVQPEGKKPMPYSAFLNGYKNKI